MNWLLIVVIIIFLISIIIGAYRGAIKIAVSLVTALITYAVVFFATPYVTKAITEFTPLDEAITDQVTSTITDLAVSQFADGSKAESGMKIIGYDPDRLIQILYVCLRKPKILLRRPGTAFFQDPFPFYPFLHKVFLHCIGFRYLFAVSLAS